MSVPAFIDQRAVEYSSYYFRVLQQLRLHELKGQHKYNINKNNNNNNNNNMDVDEDDECQNNENFDLLDLNNHISINTLREMIKEIIPMKKIKNGYMSFLFGQIYKDILNGNNLIAQVWDPDLSWDGAAKSLPTIWSPEYVSNKSKVLLDIGHSRVCNSMGMLVGYTKWLEQSTESKQLYLDQMCDWIAFMIDKAEPKYCGYYLNDFYNNINIDNATEIIASNVRDYIMYKVKKKLNIDINAKTWKNNQVL